MKSQTNTAQKSGEFFAGSINQSVLRELPYEGGETSFALNSVWMKDKRKAEVRITTSGGNYNIWLLHD